MECTIIYLDELSNEIETHRAHWASEVCVIVNNGIESGYDILVIRDKNHE